MAGQKVITAWVKWRGQRPAEHRITGPGQPHPQREALGDLDESKWEYDEMIDGPRDPWRDTRYLYLIDPRTGADYRFVTDTIGGRRAIGDLKRQTQNIRSARPGAVTLQRCHR
jgi:hypothetical protein